MALRVPYPWISRSAFWKSLSPRSHALFVVGVFVLFFTGGLLPDVARLGANSPLRLFASSCFAGGLSVAYVLVARRGPRWLLLLIAAHILITMQFDHLFGVPGPPLAGEALRARMALDVNGTTTAIIISFVLLSHVMRIEGTRYGRVHAEITLARDIHRRLVPRIATGRSGFEFHGVSVPSGEVGGDLIDLVDSGTGTGRGWTSLLADVSGHGVAAGLLMGMVKSAARTQLRDGARLDRLLNTLNAVLFDLKSPTMFVTFVGLQYDDDAGGGSSGSGGGSNSDSATLRFTVAGHLPILHYRAATREVVEVSIAQLPLAMFDDTVFTSAEVSCADGDLLVLLTDGLTEVFDTGGQEFGLDRVKALVREQAGAPLAQLEQRLLAAVHAHGPQLDDQTLFLIRRSS